jgi:PLD-like domain
MRAVFIAALLATAASAAIVAALPSADRPDVWGRESVSLASISALPNFSDVGAAAIGKLTGEVQRLGAQLNPAMQRGSALVDGGAEIHYAPEENLSRIDVGLIENAGVSIDMAAYVLTDWAILDALNDAEARGVRVRIVLDPHEHSDTGRMVGLDVRTKAPGPLQHLKDYEIDGQVLREGSENFSHSAPSQDNSLIVFRDPKAAAQFEAHFERMWNTALLVNAPATQSLLRPGLRRRSRPSVRIGMVKVMTREGKIKIKRDPIYEDDARPISYFLFNREHWAEIRRLEERPQWGISFRYGTCYGTDDLLLDTAETEEEALALAEAMIRDGRIPDPKTARNRLTAYLRFKRAAHPKWPRLIRDLDAAVAGLEAINSTKAWLGEARGLLEMLKADPP